MDTFTSGEVVLITGAGSGIGRAMAHEFAAEGARVIALDMNGRTATETVAQIEGDALAVEADVSVQADVDRAITETLATTGRLDVLCNNAGILDGYADALNTTDELWERVIGTNLTGAFRMIRAVIPPMLERGKGAIVSTASVSAFVAGGGGMAYTAAKHGIAGLTKQVAFNYGSKGIRANAIAPGGIRTPMTAGLEDDPHVKALMDATPAGRWGEPEEIARVAVFLSSHKASFAHGAVVSVDGGWIAA
ncbi:SDR family NAD(P)-dependent oxidoreductase [Amycolatopsis sacchari]|uniref:SDR family NAD(P)-dependent oxidoreductase n=1 Tax=Amycolatopsis sacchari TaxID=115433 RepID=UPI003EC0A399